MRGLDRAGRCRYRWRGRLRIARPSRRCCLGRRCDVARTVRFSHVVSRLTPRHGRAPFSRDPPRTLLTPRTSCGVRKPSMPNSNVAGIAIAAFVSLAWVVQASSAEDVRLAGDATTAAAVWARIVSACPHLRVHCDRSSRWSDGGRRRHGIQRAKTTINPFKPQNSTALVTSGVYRFTRNPMYLGLTLIVLGWATFLCSVWALAGPVLFVLYISRFQIEPEERILSAKFGAAYSDYVSRVRRWL
jgi:hypothetical protein